MTKISSVTTFIFMSLKKCPKKEILQRYHHYYELHIITPFLISFILLLSYLKNLKTETKSKIQKLYRLSVIFTLIVTNIFFLFHFINHYMNIFLLCCTCGIFFIYCAPVASSKRTEKMSCIQINYVSCQFIRTIISLCAGYYNIGFLYILFLRLTITFREVYNA